ncbi:hypothetical protein L0F63_006102 [Massospora cicadina]|nr:hypothetical protein L0F63_006102 [Massospora cicadina]
MRATLGLLKPYTFPPLPSKVELTRLSRSLAKLKKNRAFLACDVAAKQITDILGPDLWKGRTVVEFLPGPGTLTKQMILNEAAGVIPLEPAKVFHPRLSELAQCSDVPFFLEHGEHRADDTFISLLEDVPVEFRTKVPRPTHPWDEGERQPIGFLPSLLLTVLVHPKMIFASLSSSIHESYYLSQLLIYSIYRKNGWFSYGRLPVVMIAPPELLKGFVNSSLVGFLWRAIADVEVALDLSDEAFVTKHNMQAIKLIPNEAPKTKADKFSPLETFHYVLSKLMVRKAQTLASSLSALAPGAYCLRNKLGFDLSKNCMHLTLNEVDQLTLAYMDWYTNRHGAPPIHACF